MASSSRSEEGVKQRLQELQKQLAKKQAFEQAVSEIRSLVLDVYPSSSPSLRKLFYSVICRVATVLQARYTSTGFWLAGLRLFEDSERLVAGTKEKGHLKACIARVHEHIGEAENEGLDSASNNNVGSGNRYLFEGHLTMGPEPPPPRWLVAQNFLTTFAATQANLVATEASPSAGSNDGSNSTSVPAATSEMFERLISSMQEVSSFEDLDNVLEASLQEIGAGPKMPPPASKEVVANLPVITVTDEVLARLGSETECAVCRETLVVNDKMQELPCKHLYHPPCLKPWLVAKHDVMDWTSMRGWLNMPVCLSMEQEIYKASNTLRSYCQIGAMNQEKSIPPAILKGAEGLAILTVAKAGMLLTYKLGTGLVVVRRSDGSWSAPSAILSLGLGWGAQVGGGLTDFIIVLYDSKAVQTFCRPMHFSLGAGLGAAAGPLGRVMEADLQVGTKGSGMCYSYSCSKGAFVGVSLEGNIIATRTDTNLRFYGDPYITTNDILQGMVASPIAAEPLYSALRELYLKFNC